MVNNKITGLENTYHAEKYIPCWTIHTMLDNTYHAGQYIPCWTIHSMLDNTYCAGKCIPAWYVLPSMVCIVQHGMYLPA
jgi:hypothetical protein